MEQPPTIALFIDADNLSNAHLSTVLHQLEQRGTVAIRRAYGNWASPCLSAWQDKLHQFAIKPIQQFDLTKGKNATDIALSIDVMDCLHTKAIDIFAIAASDCDYTPLVMRLKEENKTVLGFGEAKSPRCYVDSFTQFIELCSKHHNANNNGQTTEQDELNFEKDKQFFAAFLEQLALSEPQQTTPSLANNAAIEHEKKSAKKANKKLNKQLKAAIEENKDEKGWARLGQIGNYMNALEGFSTKAYGAKNLSSLIKARGLFELQQRPNGLWVKLKAKTS